MTVMINVLKMTKDFCFYVMILLFLLSCQSSDIINNSNNENHPPYISPIEDQTISMNSTLGPLVFSIFDPESDPDSLDLYVISMNLNLVDSTNIILGETGEYRAITITPNWGRIGEVKIVIIVSDGSESDSSSFILNIVQSPSTQSYPTILYPLTESELATVQSTFESLNNTQIRASLDKYGLLDWSGLLNRGQSTIQNVNVAVSMAKSSLLKFNEFSNITDTVLLVVKRATNEHGSNLFSDWAIEFENQLYRDLIVEKTGIFILVHDDVRQIHGHHYTDIFIPTEEIIDKEIVTSLIDGYIIEYDCWTPQEYIIESDDIVNADIETVIYPLELNESLEFRVTYKIPIVNPQPQWYIFIDVVTGEIIEIRQLFIC